MDRLAEVEEHKMSQTLANVLSLLGLSATFLVGAAAVLVLALVSKIVKETRRQG